MQAVALLTDMAGQAECNVSIKRCFIVEIPGQSNWVVDTVETIDGIEYVQLKIKNSGFGKFVSGSIKKLRDQMCLRFLSELQKLRLKATIEACVDTTKCALFDDDEQATPVQKKQRKAAKVKASLGSIPSVVTVTCPAIRLSDGKPVGPQQVELKSSLDLREVPVVELNAHVLFYIKMAVSSTDAVHTYAPGDNVHWRADRDAWRAARDGKTKLFKPADLTDDDSIRNAKELATRWADGVGEDSPPTEDDTVEEPTLDEADTVDDSPPVDDDCVEESSPVEGDTGVECDAALCDVKGGEAGGA